MTILFRVMEREEKRFAQGKSLLLSLILPQRTVSLVAISEESPYFQTVSITVGFSQRVRAYTSSGNKYGFLYSFLVR